MNSEQDPLAADRAQARSLVAQQRLEEARAMLVRMCADHEADAGPWLLLATVYGMLRRYGDAERCSRRALDLEPGRQAGLACLGAALMGQERYPDALDCLERAVSLDERDTLAHANLGRTLAQLGRHSGSVAHFQRALALQPGNPDMHLQLGLAYSRCGDHRQASDCLGAAASRFPNISELHYYHATALQDAGWTDGALDAYRAAIRLQPGMAIAHAGLASLYQRTGDSAAAIRQYRRALDLKPDAPEIHYNLGTVYQAGGQYPEAQVCYRMALALNRGLLEAWNNLGLVFQEQGLTGEALRCFNRAIEQHPADPDGENRTLAEVRWHRGLLWLLTGDFARGWPEYEWRRADPDYTVQSFPWPRWDGSSLSGKTILVYAEQGIGDEIMFASCIPDLSNRAGHVVLACEPRLAPLFGRSFPRVTVHKASPDETASALPAVPAIDVQIAAGSLPMYLRRSLEDFPEPRPYLVPDAAAVRKWEARYREIGDGLKVGISWRGGRPAKRASRSTALDQWQDLLRTTNVSFINLQYGDCGAEIDVVRSRYGVQIHDWDDADPLQDLDDFAAQLAALDLVISIDNATVHMAGALDVPVWILQPFAPEWRWLLDREDSYWYPGVRQYRQSTPGEWDAVFERIAKELNKAARR